MRVVLLSLLFLAVAMNILLRNPASHTQRKLSVDDEDDRRRVQGEDDGKGHDQEETPARSEDHDGRTRSDKENERTGSQDDKMEEEEEGRNLKLWGMKKDQHEEIDPKTLRYLTMGTFRTFGEGLEDRESQAFPYLLSPDAVNLAKRASSPQYSAMCTMSMVGSSLADVIVLEYDMDTPENRDAVMQLAKRLRARMPEALIVFLKYWVPNRFRLKKDRLTMKEWALDKGYKDHTSEEFKNALVKGTSPDDWELVGSPQYNNDVEKVASSVDGRVVSLPAPDDAHDAILGFGRYFHQDMINFSPNGHAYIAQEIIGEIKEAKVTKKRIHVKPWEDRDECEDWHENGKMKAQHSNAVEMVEYAPGKFAAEVASEEGWIQLFNPMQHDSEVYVNYLVTTGREQKYPKTKLQLKRQATFKDVLSAKDIDPFHKYGSMEQFSELTKVGTIARRGRPVLMILPDGEDRTKVKYPIRITGIAVVKPQDTDDGEIRPDELEKHAMVGLTETDLKSVEKSSRSDGGGKREGSRDFDKVGLEDKRRHLRW